ncbi:class v aminotransferase : Serine-pyruvate aminotransferase/archaeal aspartate aminotransferase OS=Singulisphaera acidiphila (strain ATCC BAA-1392 / DSM 18658 / VKM B-2454 / MOB10) GN=Sinac_6244 PE=3 SV=1: Aminotran_5: OmdA [Gemmataceae bacterium]|nr:class v aminotransferase : Serine-pyruvate aminotransferase/archaeal aspartate aminotransferase OS=Singulisphaera acidiphila (strain ATCC BAA-1392 / DSM 18658 / VKM B-2454 / MOB10) GN=Sinac_6244 PE=3 SV=1: Aminotran_5: OmdA [Gemmataceae bacterium]VTU00604.1 class v aminotransferase : Serine-pyruvate aminotransferase/archaeal aspartate aminotransferase OS=Singulisphaera acidiphila (strain ATCC BAA-1392 / DSM 18658 / VKM B-2454 / MOB10) GN=Sinac_6244 PE=3 SV=1: Aminotran_5: OmdA [Gemmataceae bact
MKARLFTPGPTPVPEESLLELARPVTYHRSQEAKAVLAEVSEDLKYVFQTAQPVLTLTSSGTGGMEAAVANALAAGEKAILLTAGRWGERWRGVLKAFAANIVAVEVPYGKAVTPEMLQAALAANPDAKAVFATLSETSTGVGHDVEAFGKLVAKTDALLIVDAISGMGAMECKVDAWGIDICVTGSQKALMLPPGLAFVSVSEKAWKKIDATPVRSFYFDLRRYKKSYAESDTPFTPANTLIRAQRASLKRIRTEGIENLWARHNRVAAACRAGVKAMGLELFAERPNSGLTVITVPAGVDGSATLKKMEKQYGFKLADGQDNMKGKIWRLSHMGYTDAFDVLGALSALELVLVESGFKVEPGAGVAAFQKAYAAK